MTSAHRPSPRQDTRARWTALGGATCALLLAVLAGVCASGGEARTSVEARPSPAHSVSASLPGAQEHLVGVHEPSAPGQLELPRPGDKPSPVHPRFVPRQGLAARPVAPLVVRPAPRPGRLSPAHQGRVADRPVVANCPAQGPPRTA